MKQFKIALAGNPNSGKTTLFNYLTKSKQYVGNWPGVTVEKKSGEVAGKLIGDRDITIETTDLPGIYSLSPYTSEEIVTREFLVSGEPDLILNIVDATNLERNLFLTTQLLELGIKTVIALNMADELKSKHINLDAPLLSKRLGIPVIPISAAREEGIDRLMEVIISECSSGGGHTKVSFAPFSGARLELVREAESIVAKYSEPHAGWYAVKLLEGDIHAASMLGDITVADRTRIIEIQKRFCGDSCDEGVSETDTLSGRTARSIAQARYSWIHKVIEGVLDIGEMKSSRSDKIDAVITHRIIAIPLFFLIMFGIFEITFGPVGSWLFDITDYFINDIVGAGITNFLVNAGASEALISLIIDGIFAGVGAIISFVPQIMLLFFFLSALEDCGYMARVAFAMDVFLRKIGLSGKAFIPMILGFGCTVPAVMAARTLERENDRKITIMIVPFISCSARAPVYGLFITAFFAAYRGIIMLGIYALGIIVALLAALALKKTVFKSDGVPFVMELPKYRMPKITSMAKSAWEKGRGFIIKAGTVIFAASVVIWFTQNYSFSFQQVTDSSESIIAAIGRFIAPIFAPMGFGTWEAAASLLTGLTAKEAVVSTMEILYNAASEGISDVLRSVFTSASAMAFMVFTLLYTPCVAALAAIKKELVKWRRVLGTMVMQLLVAYVASLATYYAVLPVLG